MTLKSSPFIDELVMENISKVRLPSHLTYNGTTDPQDHMTSFEHHMYLFAHFEATWCKYLPTTLTEVAGTWFKYVIAEGIDSQL